MTERDSQGRFVNGHRMVDGSQKGWFKKGITHKGFIPSIEQRLEHGKKIKQRWKEGKYGKERNVKVSKSNIGRIVSKEMREKISNTLTGKKYPIELYPRKGLRTTRKNIVMPLKDSSIEVKIQNYLKQLGIDFLTHQRMKINHAYQCDILIPSMNLVIECDGTYWHSYPTGNDIDHIRTKELIENGFKVLRLWEFEINKMSIDEFRRVLDG